MLDDNGQQIVWVTSLTHKNPISYVSQIANYFYYWMRVWAVMPKQKCYEERIRENNA